MERHRAPGTDRSTSHCDSSAPARPFPFCSRTLPHLQRSAGNRALGALIQAKLRVGPVGDAHELEAESIADRVVRMPEGAAQARCGACAGAATSCPECAAQRRRAGQHSSVPDGSCEAAVPGAGEALSDGTREFFEPRFGRDFSHVRVHTDARAAESARALDAIAYTVGRDIVFDRGEYAPETDAGRRLLAHELAHVVQQGRTPGPQAVQRTVRVLPDAAARSEMLGLFDFLCPTGQFQISGEWIDSNCPSTAGPSCECLCDVTRDPTRTYTIEVEDAARVDRFEVLHDFSIVEIPDTSDGPHTSPGPDPTVLMTRSSSPIEFGMFRPDCTAMWAPNWRILGHELCGHARLNQTYAGDKGNRAGHDSTIDTENAIAAEHGGGPRGHYADVRQGESFHNPAGDRSRIVFKLRDGWHFESPSACAAPAVPAAAVPSTATPNPPPDFRWTISAVGGLEARELQGLAGLSAQLSLESGPLVVYNPIVGLNLLYGPSTELQPHELLLAMAHLGLRIQQPIRGAYLDLAAGGFLGFDAQIGGSRELTGGIQAGAGFGWRFERVELGVEAKALFPLTENDLTRVLILGRIGVRLGK